MVEIKDLDECDEIVANINSPYEVIGRFVGHIEGEDLCLMKAPNGQVTLWDRAVITKVENKQPALSFRRGDEIQATFIVEEVLSTGSIHVSVKGHTNKEAAYFTPSELSYMTKK